jgi:hypothetical protein
MRQKQALTDSAEPIDDAKTYSLDQFQNATGWGRHAVMQARRQGLKAVKVSGRLFIRGQDFSVFIGSQPNAEVEL